MHSFGNQTWIDYVQGFGNDKNKGYWLGLDRIHLLTTKNVNVDSDLRIDLFGDVNEENCPPHYHLQCNRNGHWQATWREFVVSH